MKLPQAIASLVLTAIIAGATPAAPSYANGAASTRNLLLLGGAATYLIVQHNRKVHERYAQDAQRQAALEQGNDDAWAAYRAERRAYQEEVAVNASLRHQLALLNVRPDFATQRVATVSYGWGQL